MKKCVFKINNKKTKMIRRRIFSLQTASFVRFNSQSILPDQTNDNNEPSPLPEKISRHEALGKRWRISGFSSATTSNDEIGKDSNAKSTTKSSTTTTKENTNQGQGFFSRMFRSITRRDEIEEEEELKKFLSSASSQQNDTNTNTKNKSSSQLLESLRAQNPDIEAIDQFSGVDFAVYERLDVSIRYVAPIEWSVNTRVSENFVAVQCVPPSSSSSGSNRGVEDDDEENDSFVEEVILESEEGKSSTKKVYSSSSSSSIHGLSISNFVYLSKVPPTVSANDLMKSFLTQFHRSVGRTSVVVGSSAFSEDQMTNEVTKQSSNMCREIVQMSGFNQQQQQQNQQQQQQSNSPQNPNQKTSSNTNVASCAVCELVFKANSPNKNNSKNQINNNQNHAIPARALCKVFFHRSRRKHTVVVFAVPDDEWNAVKDLVKHSVICVAEMTHHNTGKVDY
jgi:hypothetical protein